MKRLLAFLILASLSLLAPDFAQTATKPAAEPAHVSTSQRPQPNFPFTASCSTRMASAISSTSGRVNGSQELNIRFTTAQLNDVLKSLAVVDLGGGRWAACATTPLPRSASG